MDWEAAIERRSEALTRIRVALAAMAALLVMSRARLPRSVYRAVLRPLLAAQAAALPFAEAVPLSPSDNPGLDPVAAALLRRRFAALARAIADLIQRLLAPQPAADAGPARAVVRPPALPYSLASLAPRPDTS